MFKKLLCMFESMRIRQCQSCGMPLDKDPGHGGTEKDGVTHSTKWCSLCYRDGEFTGKDCTLEDMKQIVTDAMQKDGMSSMMQKMALWQLPRLERWKR